MASHSLSHDAWAAIGQYLGPVSLHNLSCTCTGLYHDISSNNALWQAQAERRWPGLSTAVHANVQDWHRVYHAAHRASYALATQQPWTASITSTSSIPAPRTAQLLVLQSLAPMHSVASSDDGSHAGPAWHATTVAAAAIAGRLHWWQWSANTETDPPYVNAAAAHGSPCKGPDSDIDSDTNADVRDGQVTAQAAAVAAAQAHGRAAQHWSSDSLHGHTAPVTALIAVPTGGPISGFASGSQDTTIKLWTPFTSGGSRSTAAAGGPIRPSRTFCSHTGRVTALACLQHSTDAIGVSNARFAPILVSASADRTIKLWSLVSIQQTQPSSGSSRTQNRSSSGTKQAAGAGDSYDHQGGAVHRGNSKPQQQARNPLLGTLRGHSGPVTSLLAWPAASPAANGHSPASGLLSGSDDSRVKLWDVSEGRRACAATWRLQVPCMQLLSGLDLPGCAVAVLPNGLQVIDTRVPSGGSAPTRGVLTLSWCSSNLTTAAAAGMTIAAGGREGVRAWDVRMAGSTSSTSCSTPDVDSTAATGSRGSGRWPLLLSGALLGKVSVTHLQLDQVKVVAASSRPQLGCGAGVAVWSLATGERVDLPSSCLSGIHCRESRAPDRAAALALDCAVGAGHMAVRELLSALPSKQRAKADAFFTGMHEDDAGSDGDGSELSELLEDLLGIAGEDSDGHESVGDSESEESVDGAGAAGFRRAGTDIDNGVEDCVEPGVLAMATTGPILACIDTLGNLLLSDYTSGMPSTELVRQHGACNSFGVTGQPASCRNEAESVVYGGMGQEGSVLNAAAEPAPTEDIAGQLARLKFWRS